MNNASLGQVEFADWYDNPLFESDPDERLEELATSSRGPIRLAASAILRVDARTARLRHRAPTPIGSNPLATPPEPPRTKPAAAARTEPTPRTKPAASRAKPIAAARPKPASRAKPAAAARPKPAPGRTKAVRTKPLVDPKDAPLDERAWKGWSSDVEDNGLGHAMEALDQEHRRGGRRLSGLRARMSTAIDSWAEKETAIGLRLDRVLMPWRREP
jgi:hypothetical protein